MHQNRQVTSLGDSLGTTSWARAGVEKHLDRLPTIYISNDILKRNNLLKYFCSICPHHFSEQSYTNNFNWTLNWKVLLVLKASIMSKSNLVISLIPLWIGLLHKMSQICGHNIIWKMETFWLIMWAFFKW